MKRGTQPPSRLHYFEISDTQNMDVRWSWFDVTESFFETKAPWLKEARTLHGSSVRFFELAGKLVWLSRDDYELSSLAFFQAVIGLERALRLHFRKQTEPYASLAAPGESLASLLDRAMSEGIVTDAAFSEIRPFSDHIRSQLEVTVDTHCRALSVLVPKLRNQFMHGTYLLAPDYLHLAIQMREIADLLVTRRP
ncbi:MAG: hypothetical protein V4719_06485 [Planctomycetota bacterium]